MSDNAKNGAWREALEAACLEGLILTEYGYRYRPSLGADAVERLMRADVAAGLTRAAEIVESANSEDAADQLRRARFHERENFDRWQAAEAVLDALGVEKWTPEDGDARCQQCNRPNVVWVAENDLWNAVVGDRGGILCPLCFALAADASPQRPRLWRLVAVDE